MRKRRSYFLFICVGAVIFLFNASILRAEKDSDAVEIIVQGQRYKSIREYKRQQIKDVLKESLSARNLRDLTDDEIYEVIREARDNQKSNNLSKEVTKTSKEASGVSLGKQRKTGDAQDLSAEQMQEMLESYYEEHKGAEPVVIDPGKVKSIIIKP